MYSYSLLLSNIDPNGSTNYGKLANVTIESVPSDECKALAGASDATHLKQSYTYTLAAINLNLIRISGGALGFPVL